MNLTSRTGDVRRGTVGPLLGRAAAAEWGELWAAVGGRLARRRLAAVPLALTATLLVLLFDLVQQLPGGAGFVERVGVVRAGLPLELELLRTPLSLFVPALDLPVWGALAQVLVVFAVAEIVLGRPLALFVAYAGTVAGTLYARVAVDVGPGGFLGLPATDALVRDAGPSAAVVALAICAAWRARAWFTGAAVVALMGTEAAVLPNLAGLEHLAAIAAAVLIAALGEVFGGYWSRVLALARAATETVRTASGAAAR
ncbi:hypothetical protein ACIQGZ_01415 [Streptomyces sp. NPDC092296]|uniref:hypothetical protein n=1 Tax=Streptomyces sp. NPDC092296 TaxID=3366012 RepID=UPI00381D05BF